MHLCTISILLSILLTTTMSFTSSASRSLLTASRRLGASRRTHPSSLLRPSSTLTFASFLQPRVVGGAAFAPQSLLKLPPSQLKGMNTVSTTCAADLSLAKPKEIFRKDYMQPAHWVTNVKMDFNIRPNLTTVSTELKIDINSNSKHSKKDLYLDGDGSCITLKEVVLNGKSLVVGVDYTLTSSQLIVHEAVLKSPTNILKVTVITIPEENTQLSGLYKSNTMYCTQCEAEGFRRITYYPDRPDNMAVFDEVKITADKAKYPVLLSNGNLLTKQDNVNGDITRHTATWSDPYPKPSYLFAAVIGSLGSITDSYVTTSGRNVHLEIFSEHQNVKKLDYAMSSLKRSMKWDEDAFGLEYDLDVYNIVAVEDFNMGAMENKGLNVFNTAYVLADQGTASDVDFERVEGVIGHEYFHNWTGNRVTCRDWFQLTLKEGLTVFRDQEFSGQMNSPIVKRIEEVKGLRSRQFSEDSGPMSHPIRPESYIAMDNFYTATVYQKGAEVVRMYNTLLGVEGFKKGMDLYFERHDGQAVTCDDFRSSMSAANSNLDLTQFENWYLQPGTPQLSYSSNYDEASKTFTLKLTQSSPNAPTNKPFHIPVSFGIIDSATGKELLRTKVLELKENSQTFAFQLARVTGKPIPSILRDFSAPVKLMREGGDEDDEDLITLAAFDSDGFNKWEAGQKLASRVIFRILQAEAEAGDEEIDGSVYKSSFEFFSQIINDISGTDDGDESIMSYAMMLPDESALSEMMSTIDPSGIRSARSNLKKAIGNKFESRLNEIYTKLTKEMDGGEFKVDSVSIGKRRLRNVCLDYLCSSSSNGDGGKEKRGELAFAHYVNANCMTDKLAGLTQLVNMEGSSNIENMKQQALDKFYEDANGDALVTNKWFSIQAMSTLPNVVTVVQSLTTHKDFMIKNPNRLRSLASVFAANLASFHNVDGSGYKFISDLVKRVDKVNPQVASRLVGSLIGFKRYDSVRGGIMKGELEGIKGVEGISDDLLEIVDKALK